jgi:hypothetical protein
MSKPHYHFINTNNPVSADIHKNEIYFVNMTIDYKSIQLSINNGAR